jgi:hypothetical protein
MGKWQESAGGVFKRAKRKKISNYEVLGYKRNFQYLGVSMRFVQDVEIALSETE